MLKKDSSGFEFLVIQVYSAWSFAASHLKGIIVREEYDQGRIEEGLCAPI